MIREFCKISTEKQISFKKLKDKKVGNRKRLVDKNTQTFESKLIVPTEINSLKSQDSIQSSNLKDKAPKQDKDTDTD